MRRLLLIPAIVLGGLLIACSDDDSNDPEPGSPTAAAESEDETPEAADLPQGLQFVLDGAGSADGPDIEELREHLSPELQNMSNEEIGEAVICFPSDVVAEVMDQQVTESGNTATLVETWQVTEEGASSIETEVEREWTFEKVQEGEATGYVITGLPSECPFQGADPSGTQEPAIDTPASGN